MKSIRWRRGNSGMSLCVSLCLSWPLMAASQTTAPAPEPQRIEVHGGSADAQRRASVGAVVVVSRDELLKQGDTRLADALRRVPGITVVQGGSRGPEIRMSGLGGGYTQILLNGEPAPAGFSLESLSPELVERVEVSRNASAEQGSQGIAGSINIVLRRAPSSAQRTLKAAIGSKLGRPVFSADLQWGNKLDAGSWGLGAGLESERRLWPMTLQRQTVDASGNVTQATTTHTTEFDKADRLVLTPRASWTLSPSQALTTDHLLRLAHAHSGGTSLRTSDAGPPPPFEFDSLYLKIRDLRLRSRVGWTLSQEDGSRWELKGGYTLQRRLSDGHMNGFDFDGRWVQEARVHSVAVDRSWSLSGRLRKPLGEAHAASIGWDAEDGRRTDERIQRETPLPGGLPVENLDESYDAGVQRLAVFVQDEWALSAAWTTTLGLRWEGLRTRSEGNVFDGVQSRSSVFSPTVQAVWRVPGRKDQVRVGLARSYKPPTPRELMPRRFVVNDNTPTSPNFQGNPALRPELAWGLDLAWEHPVAPGALLTLSGYAKRIDDVVITELTQQNGAWVERRINQGTASLRGLEAEARLSLRQWRAGLPALDLRGNLALNRSKVAAVPGPDNRLAEQVPWSINLGADHRPDGVPFTWGASASYQQGGPQRLSALRSSDTTPVRGLDLYATWKPDARTQWRLTINQLWQADPVAERTVLADGNAYRVNDRLRTGPSVRLSLDLPLNLGR